MRAVAKDVNASPFKRSKQSSREAKTLLSLPVRLSEAALIRAILNNKPELTKHLAKHVDLHANENAFAITVPKRLAKRAVDRNAIKRLIREFYRLSQRDHPDTMQRVVFRLRKKIGETTRLKLREAERQEIRTELAQWNKKSSD